MGEDYEDYENFVDNPPRLIACSPDNVTVPSMAGGPVGYCVQPFVLDGRNLRNLSTGAQRTPRYVKCCGTGDF